MSTISAGNTLTTGFVASSDTTGNLVLSATGNIVVPANGITFSDGTSIASHAAPNVQVFTSGSGTYTTPTGAKYLTVKMVGGGSSGGTVAADPVVGGNTTFGTSLLTCVGGLSASTGTAPAGGTASGGDYNVSGSYGGVGPNGTPMGGNGGPSPFGGAGGGGTGASTSGTNAAANSGSGGGGGYTSNVGRAGGASGGYLEKTITLPSSTYSYAVGAGGTAPSGAGNGGSGVIIVTAYF